MIAQSNNYLEVDLCYTKYKLCSSSKPPTLMKTLNLFSHNTMNT